MFIVIEGANIESKKKSHWQLEILHRVTILLLLFLYHVKNVHYKRIVTYELNLLLYLYYIKNVYYKGSLK